MKILYAGIMLLIITFFLAGCGTKPFLKTEELPKNIQFYSAEKQFKVNPEWYWRIRPWSGNPTRDSSDQEYGIIGHFYLNDKTGSGLVIGECNSEPYYLSNGLFKAATLIPSEKFYIVKWDNYGYFFIMEKDYLFAEKFKNQKIHLNYGNWDAYQYDYQHSLMFYYDNTPPRNPDKISVDAVRSGLNLKIIFNMTLIKSFMMNNKSYNPKYSDIVNDAIQLSSTEYFRGGYSENFTNEFLKFTSCPLFSEFTGNESISPIECVAVENIGTTQYTNTQGMMFMGVLYQTKYIIARWGKVFYAFPCE